MKFRKSYLVAIGLFVLIGIWFLINAGKGEEDVAAAPAAQSEPDALPTVVFEYREASDHAKKLSLYGRTEAAREVIVKAQTAGRIVSAPAREGAIVQKGDLLCRQDVDARQAMLDQAKANLRSVEVDLKAARTLAEKGYQSATRVTAIPAQLDGAKAAIASAEIELGNINITAPFAGVWERQMAEMGDYLAPGQACGLLVELSPLIARIDLTEDQVGRIKRGQAASVVLATQPDAPITGKVRRIESKANPATRTFSAEIALPNPNMSLKAGVTATVSLDAGMTRAQQIPSSILTLSDAGDIGVRYLDSDDRVRFAAVKTIDEDASGIWVTGLPDQTRVLVQGQDFVSEGTLVNPTSDSGMAAANTPRPAQ